MKKRRLLKVLAATLALSMVIAATSVASAISYEDSAASTQTQTGAAGENIILAAPAASTAALTASQVKSLKPEASASTYNYSKIKISWEKIEGVGGYQVYRASSKTGTYKKVGSVTKESASYLDGSLTCGKTYYYKVRAFKKINGKYYYSKFSSIIEKKAVPGKVKELSVKGEPGSNVSLSIDWRSVYGASGYEEQVNTCRDGKWSGWKSYTYDQFEEKCDIQDYHDTLDHLKKKHPSGEYTTIRDGKIVTLTVKESAEMWGKTHAISRASQQNGITYKFRVRAYRTVNGKKVYGAWSDVISLKETIDPVKLKKDIEAYILETKEGFNLYSEDYQQYISPECGSYIIDGMFGTISRWATQEDALEYLKGKVDLYQGKEGFVFIRWQNPGDREGLSYSGDVDSYWYVWLLY